MNPRLALPYITYNRSVKNYIDSFSTKESNIAGLIIEDRDIELINGSVSDLIIRGNITDAHYNLKKEISRNANGNKVITIYTDGSLTIDRKKDIVHIGYC